MPDGGGRLYTHEVAKIFGVHANTIRNWADTGRLPYVRIRGGAGERRFDPAAIEQLRQAELKITASDGTDLTEVVRQLYDMAIGSMDYGSGFLSTEEMQALLDLARILGASDVLAVQAKLAQLKFPQGPDAPKHEFQPDREGPIDLACCLVCGLDIDDPPYLHPLDAYPEIRELVAQRLAAQKERDLRYRMPVVSDVAPLPAVEAQWEREVGLDGNVTIRVTAAGVLPETVLPHGKAKAVESGDIIQFRISDEHAANCSSCPGGC